MATLSDYIEITAEQARAQWRGILERVPTSGRQGEFEPVETLLCYALGLDPSASSPARASLLRSSPLVQQVAELLHRKPSSLDIKLANLAGLWAKGGKHDGDVWIALGTTPGLTSHVYSVILRAARDVGIGADRLPDFLGAEQGNIEAAASAITVSDDALRESIEPDLTAALNHPVHQLDEIRTERKLFVKARIGQQKFAQQVLTRSNRRCVFCGLGTQQHGLPTARMLVASHIKPWKTSSTNERVDPLNGLAACPTHDAAFENHLILIDRGGRILRSPGVETAVHRDEAWRQFFGPGGLRQELLLPTGSEPGAQYVDWQLSDAGVVIEYEGRVRSRATP